VQTAHSDKIFGLAFPASYGEVFATCSAGGIRVWHLAGCRELLRISLPNLDCKCVTFAPVRQCRIGSSCMQDSGPLWHNCCSCLLALAVLHAYSHVHQPFASTVSEYDAGPHI
jgi:hypothetical protein